MGQKHKSKYSYTDDQFIEAVKSSLSVAAVCRLLNIKPSGGNYSTVYKKVKELVLDISHFTGQGWCQGDKHKHFSKAYTSDEVFVEDSPAGTFTAKKFLYRLKLKEERCECCSNDTWLGKPIKLELHHMNGNNRDNRIENLQILCPNCHSFTDNFRGKNQQRKAVNKLIIEKIKIINNKFCKCGKEINLKSTNCVICSAYNNRKVERPDKLVLQIELNNSNYHRISKKYGVSAITIKNWLK